MPITFCVCGQELCHPVGDTPVCKCGNFRKQGLNPPTAEVKSEPEKKHFGSPGLEVKKRFGKITESMLVKSDGRDEKDQMSDV